MKTIRTKFLSLLLALVTILSLLPTAAFAASNTGSGLKITTNQAYWSTRLLANGTPYSYRPPLVDGKLVYCMDSGLGYHYATPSYLNSFTWTSGTGADADAVLQSAVTNSGLSEMDAATVENVKWMMTYLNDCKSSNVGQLFMAVQTYVWENQSYKGEPGGDGDAGGYANADTYELYLSLIDSLLAKKAAEDAEFQRQIEEYKSQGIRASIVEDESAKWAVFAISSNRKNQSFFNYYGPRKLVTGEPAPDQPEQPSIDGKDTIVAKDRPKNKKSYRTLPLVPEYRRLLLQMKKHQEEYRELCGNCYHESDYIYVNDLGEPIRPNYVSQHFKLVLKNNNLREITFHELRHTCASLLLKSGISMKDIQAWLGHSNYNTTANIYAHLESSSKEITGNAMQDNFTISANLAAREAVQE